MKCAQDPKGKANEEDDSDEGEEGGDCNEDSGSDAVDDEDAPSAAEKRKDGRTRSAEAAYFVLASSIDQYTDAERLFGGEPRKYAKGTFIYRLAGRRKSLPLLHTRSAHALLGRTRTQRDFAANR